MDYKGTIQDRLDCCPWLIKRFIDPEAEIIYVPYDQVVRKAEELRATPFDVPWVEYTHYGTDCTFDYFVKKYTITNPAVRTLALIGKIPRKKDGCCNYPIFKIFSCFIF
jgi:hypothetical protein